MILAGGRLVKARSQPCGRRGAGAGSSRPLATGNMGAVRGTLGFGGRDEIAVLPFMLDALEYFFAMHGHRAWRVDSHANLVALHAQDGDRDLITDHDRLTYASRQNQHVSPP